GEIAVDLLNRCTRPFNLTGLPTVSVPCGFTSEGLPVGMQITGRAFDESTVLRVAHAYEQDAGWFQRRPPVYTSMFKKILIANPGEIPVRVIPACRGMGM